MADTELDISDEDFERFSDDPSLIEDQAILRQMIDELANGIAGIAVQLDAYAIEAAARMPSEERQAWQRRASYARAIKSKQLDGLIKRGRELRGVYSQQSVAAVKRQEKADKQARLLLEAQGRREKLKLQHEELQLRRGLNGSFVSLAKERLAPDLFEELLAAAKERVKVLADG